MPYAEVEVEYYNKDGKAVAPTDYMVTQTIKADGNGVFTYGAPKAGWWKRRWHRMEARISRLSTVTCASNPSLTGSMPIASPRSCG